MRPSRFITWKERPFLVTTFGLAANKREMCVLKEFALRGEYSPELFIRTVNGWCFIEEEVRHERKRVAGAHTRINLT